MKYKKLVIVFLLYILAISCTSIYSVGIIHEYDREVDFTAFKSYDWLPMPENNIKYGLIVKQITGEMNNQMKVRGFNKDSQHPDFLIALHGGIQNKLSFPEWQYLSENYEKYAMRRRFDIADYTDERFIIDFIDTKTKALVYRATVTAYLSLDPTSETREKKITKAVKQILDDYAQVLKH